jgi:hypothetical protein
MSLHQNILNYRVYRNEEFERRMHRARQVRQANRLKVKERKLNANIIVEYYKMKVQSSNLIDVDNKVLSLSSYVKLPPELLSEILTFITGDKEPSIFQNPLSITKEILNAGLVSWEFQLASKKALQSFGDLYGKYNYLTKSFLIPNIYKRSKLYEF